MELSSEETTDIHATDSISLCRAEVSTSFFSKNQAIWRSRRGLLELDLYLTPFAESCFDDLSTDLKQQYGELLECEDPEILAWLKEDADVPLEYASIITKIVESVRQRPDFDSDE
ncbi:MAG: succinate dehydrogenase assembly factor 2 [Gammaproteobacteria bacterium]|nr:succinate dehydrogenase assembly factor 2 [Gammaproteobacteria bacterium]